MCSCILANATPKKSCGLRREKQTGTGEELLVSCAEGHILSSRRHQIFLITSKRSTNPCLVLLILSMPVPSLVAAEHVLRREYLHAPVNDGVNISRDVGCICHTTSLDLDETLAPMDAWKAWAESSHMKGSNVLLREERSSLRGGLHLFGSNNHILMELIVRFSWENE